jgi:hypothetical protein
VKVFATFALVLAGLIPSHADATQTWNLTASCEEVPLVSVCTDPANINAVLVTQMEFGTFVDPSGLGIPETGVEPFITSITGTYDGFAMSLAPGDGWMDVIVPGAPFPQLTSFMAGGNEYLLYWDGFAYVDPQSNANPREALNWTAVDVPEPPFFWLLLTALSLLGLSRWAQMSLRKLSGR